MFIRKTFPLRIRLQSFVDLRQESADEAIEHRRYSEEKQTCEVCGYESDRGDIGSHHIIPTRVTEEAGVPQSQTVRLCSNCHREVEKWYRAEVNHTAYDHTAKRFIPKSHSEMIEIYQSAFDKFLKYRKTGKRRINKKT